ncbi:MAG: hypothetical protein GY716_12730 [bacterium]|nr:hypothetical protein [bacterium]
MTEFLRSVDTHLSKQQSVILIGGAAAALAYGATRVTTDIDTITDTTGLEEALRLARVDTGLDVPFQTVGIYDVPYHYEARLESIDLGLRKLAIVVPEKHDLALMKVVRGQENDMEAIQQIADVVGLDRTILVDRFKSEMTHAIGSPDRLRANFLSAIEMLYGEPEADRVNSELADSVE